MSSYSPAKGSDANIAASINETMMSTLQPEDVSTLYPREGYGGFDVLKYGGVDQRTIQGHNDWVQQMAPWSTTVRYRGQEIEQQPPSGWLYRFPSAVPIRPDARTLTELGPADYLPYDGSKIYFAHKTIESELPAYKRPLFNTLPFMRYGMS